MAVVSLLYFDMLNGLSLCFALICTAAAALVDARTYRIPDMITFPAIFAGIALICLRCMNGLPVLEATMTCMVAWSYVYVIWRCGLWGGGDAKLVLAVFLLASPAYKPLTFIQAFSIYLAAVLLLRHLLFPAIAGAMSGKPSMMAAALTPLACSIILYVFTYGYGPMPSAISAAIAFIVMADLIAGALPYYERISFSTCDPFSLAGRRLVEDIYLHDGVVERVMRPPGLIRRCLHMARTGRSSAGLLVPDRPTGLLAGDIRLLMRHIPDVNVAVQHPMGPAILVALVAALISGEHLLSALRLVPL